LKLYRRSQTGQQRGNGERPHVLPAYFNFACHSEARRQSGIPAGCAPLSLPYSNYKFLFQRKVGDLPGEKFLKPEHVRWEKHRVWVEEGNLKEGVRHLCGKRRFYFDEDSWSAYAGEMYDGRGNL
jgi:hypothetical protein